MRSRFHGILAALIMLGLFSERAHGEGATGKSVPKEMAGWSEGMETAEPANMTVKELFESLRRNPLTALYYDTSSFPDAMIELISRFGIAGEIVEEFSSEESAMGRFSLLVVVNQRFLAGVETETDRVATVLWNGIFDSSPWVRCEAIWGLGNIGDIGATQEALRLLDDFDTNVVTEALTALAKWHGGYAPHALTTEDERTAAAAAWKTWLDSESAAVVFPMTFTMTARPVSLTAFTTDLSALIENFTATYHRFPFSALELDAHAAKGGWPPIVWTRPDGSRIDYVKSPGHNSWTLLEFDTDGVLMRSHYSLGNYSGRASMIAPATPADRIVGACQVNLLWTAPWEMNVAGHAVADALRSATGADVALVNAYALRGNIPAGAISEEQIAELLPFTNTVSVVSMRGEDLVEVIRRGVDERWFLYPSGLTAKHNHHLGIPTFEVWLQNGDTVDTSREYRVAVPSYLARGGDGYFWFQRGQHEDNSMTLVEAFSRYIRSKPNWLPLNLPRVTEF